jgi:hypothetical protein
MLGGRFAPNEEAYLELAAEASRDPRLPARDVALKLDRALDGRSDPNPPVDRAELLQFALELARGAE